MRYFVWRRDTLSGVYYQVSAHAYARPVKAVCIGELESASRANAAWHLQQSLKQGLARADNFMPGPHF